MLSAQLIINPDRNNPRSPGFDLAYLIMSRTYGYLVDFLNMVTLLYMFYCLGISAENESHNNRYTRKIKTVRKITQRPFTEALNQDTSTTNESVDQERLETEYEEGDLSMLEVQTLFRQFLL